MYVEDDEDLSFLPRKPSPSFCTGSPSALINNEPLLLEVKPLDNANPEQLVKNTADSGVSPARKEMLVIGTSSFAGRIKDRNCRTKGSTKPPMKCKLVHVGSSLRSTRQNSSLAKVKSSQFLTISDDEEGLPDALELQTAIDYHLMISNVTLMAWKVHLDNHLDVKLLDLHDRCYARQAVVDNAVNQRAQELLRVVEQMKRECEVLKEREKARDKECKDLKAKCEAAMEDFDKNPAMMVLCQKIMFLLDEVKENKESMERMLLENKKWAGYQENLATLESKVAALEVEKGKLEAAEAMLRQEVEAVKCDRSEVVSKVVPYVTMELVQGDEMAMLVVKLVSYVVFYGRCAAFEEVADMKEPFDLAKVKDSEADYRAIVYDDELTSSENVSSKPTVSIYDAIKIDFDFSISFFDFDDGDYTFICDKDSFSYTLIPVDDLKPKPVNEHVKINTELCSENIDIKPMDSVVCISDDTTPIEFDKNIETNHDDKSKPSN
ncbi:hypothetical protein Tco_0557299 [Tanacetum coccineum]